MRFLRGLRKEYENAKTVAEKANIFLGDNPPLHEQTKTGWFNRTFNWNQTGGKFFRELPPTDQSEILNHLGEKDTTTRSNLYQSLTSKQKINVFNAAVPKGSLKGIPEPTKALFKSLDPKEQIKLLNSSELNSTAKGELFTSLDAKEQIDLLKNNKVGELYSKAKKSSYADFREKYPPSFLGLVNPFFALSSPVQYVKNVLNIFVTQPLAMIGYAAAWIGARLVPEKKTRKGQKFFNDLDSHHQAKILSDLSETDPKLAQDLFKGLSDSYFDFRDSSKKRAEVLEKMCAMDPKDKSQEKAQNLFNGLDGNKQKEILKIMQSKGNINGISILIAGMDKDKNKQSSAFNDLDTKTKASVLVNLMGSSDPSRRNTAQELFNKLPEKDPLKPKKAADILKAVCKESPKAAADLMNGSKDHLAIWKELRELGTSQTRMQIFAHLKPDKQIDILINGETSEHGNSDLIKIFSGLNPQKQADLIHKLSAQAPEAAKRYSAALNNGSSINKAGVLIALFNEKRDDTATNLFKETFQLSKAKIILKTVAEAEPKYAAKLLDSLSSVDRIDAWKNLKGDSETRKKIFKHLSNDSKAEILKYGDTALFNRTSDIVGIFKTAGAVEQAKLLNLLCKEKFGDGAVLKYFDSLDKKQKKNIEALKVEDGLEPETVTRIEMERSGTPAKKENPEDGELDEKFKKVREEIGGEPEREEEVGIVAGAGEEKDNEPEEEQDREPDKDNDEELKEEEDGGLDKDNDEEPEEEKDSRLDEKHTQKNKEANLQTNDEESSNIKKPGTTPTPGGKKPQQEPESKESKRDEGAKDAREVKPTPTNSSGISASATIVPKPPANRLLSTVKIIPLTLDSNSNDRQQQSPQNGLTH